VLLVTTATTVGLDRAMSAALEPWRHPLAVHDPGKVLLDLAMAIAIGGDCLADIGQVRAMPAVFGPVASDPTVSRLIDRLAVDVDRAERAIDAARAQTRRVVWDLAGADAPDHEICPKQPLAVDTDATLLTVAFGEGTRGTDVQTRIRVPPVLCVRRSRPAGHRGAAHGAAP